MPPLRRPLLCMLLACALLVPLAARPHATKLSSSRVQLSRSSAEVVIELNGRDVDVALKTALIDTAGSVVAARLAAAEPVLSSYLLEHTRLFNRNAGSCRATVASIEALGEHVLARLNWRCAPVTGELIYRVTLFQDVDPAARHLVTVSGEARGMALLGGGRTETVLTQTHAQFTAVLAHYLLAGIEHIGGGFDHIAFLVALILWGRRLWPLVGVVTAFTVAHSITLTLAVTGVVTLPSRLVEAVIALSIVYVAVENFFVRDLRHRWWLAFVFGLAHGFGFASALREYGLPRDQLVPALAAFNLGVEVGQIGIVVSALLALSAVGAGGLRAQPAPRFVWTVSAAIALLGLYWTVQRVLLAA